MLKRAYFDDKKLFPAQWEMICVYQSDIKRKMSQTFLILTFSIISYPYLHSNTVGFVPNAQNSSIFVKALLVNSFNGFRQWQGYALPNGVLIVEKKNVIRKAIV